MSITIHRPGAPLDTYINCMWYCDDHLSFPRLKVLPMPSLHLMINFGDAYQVYQADRSEPFATCAESWSVGLWSAYHLMSVPRDMQVLNVSFKPGGAFPFLGYPLSELHTQIVPLDSLWGRCAAEIRERLYDVRSLQARFTLLERFLLDRLCDVPHGFGVVQHAIEQIARRHGALSIRGLSDSIGISQKHLIHQFKWIAGGTPKELALLYRFKHVLQSIDLAQDVDWMLIARQFGYYDQSHFNKDFEAFTGHNLTEYLHLRRRDTEFPSHPSCLPTG